MGYCILDLDGDAPQCLDWGALDGGRSKEIAVRLAVLFDALRAVADRWRPDELAVEEPFVAPERGAKSAVAVGQAQAVALIVAAQAGLPIRRYPPAKVKSAVANYGAGTKAQVQRSVRLILGLGDAPMSEDASDAVAVALCHAQTRRAEGRMAVR